MPVMLVLALTPQSCSLLNMGRPPSWNFSGLVAFLRCLFESGCRWPRSGTSDEPSSWGAFLSSAARARARSQRLGRLLLVRPGRHRGDRHHCRCCGRDFGVAVCAIRRRQVLPVLAVEGLLWTERHCRSGCCSCSHRGQCRRRRCPGRECTQCQRHFGTRLCRCQWHCQCRCKPPRRRASAAPTPGSESTVHLGLLPVPVGLAVALAAAP